MNNPSILKSWLEYVKGQKTERMVSVRIDGEDEEQKSNIFQPDESYFVIRVAEMFVRDRRQFTRTFIPLAVAVTEFLYAGKQEIVPFVVGKEILKSIDQYVSGNKVEYRNTSVAGPIPYMGGNFGLFIGLYRTEVSDLSRKLFGLLGGILSRFDATGLSRYLDLAEPLGAGLRDLLGMKEVEFRLGQREEFDAVSGSSQFRSGYLAHLNCTEADLRNKHLLIRDGLLHVKENDGPLRRFDDCDYCLTLIEHLSERTDYTALSFHEFWKDAQGHIWHDEPEKAKGSFMQLIQELAKSPDLTKKHRFRLMQIYKANFETESEMHGSMKFGERGVDTVRSGGHSSAKGAIQQAAYVATQAKLSRAAEALSELNLRWDAVTKLDSRKPKQVLTDEILIAQMQRLEQDSAITEPDPDSLASALTIAAFSGP
jgi:hypothetical protein